jgi:hypothetical protein
MGQRFCIVVDVTSLQVHPILRLAAWVKRVHQESKRNIPTLDCLLKLKIIDQIGFPLVLDVGYNSSIQSCDAFSQKGNYNNLLWMQEMLTHGYASINVLPATLLTGTKLSLSGKHILLLVPRTLGNCLVCVQYVTFFFSFFFFFFFCRSGTCGTQ